MLIGIVKKDAIIVIDFALRQRERNDGLSSEDSTTEACVLRFRPIMMMTTMAALLGIMPSAIGWAAGADLRRRSPSPWSAG